MAESETSFRVRQRDASKGFFAMAVLGGVCAQKLPPRGCVEVKLLYGHGRPGSQRRRLRHANFTAVDFDTPGVSRVARARGQTQARYCSNRGERLAAKPEG